MDQYMVMLFMKPALVQEVIVAGIQIILPLLLPRTLGSVAGATGALPRTQECLLSASAMVLRFRTVPFAPRSGRFDKIFPKGKFCTVSKKTVSNMK